MDPSLIETLMLAISQSMEGIRSIPATLEMAATSSGDFQAANVKGARLVVVRKELGRSVGCLVGVGCESYAGPMPLTMFLLKVEQN